MKKNYTHIAMVLDSSGSMMSVAADTIGGFNSFVQKQREVDGDVTISMITFDDNYKLVKDFVNIKEFNDITKEDYRPSGYTALYDAVGYTIDSVGKKLSEMKEEDRPESVMVIVMTDGMENRSKEYTRDIIKQKIEHQTEKYNWEIIFIGANQDAILTGATLGVKSAASITYTNNSVGTSNLFDSLGEAVSLYRSDLRPVHEKSFTFKQADRDAQNVK